MMASRKETDKIEWNSILNEDNERGVSEENKGGVIQRFLIIQRVCKKHLTLHTDMMASMKEADNSRFIPDMKRMKIDWNNIFSEDNEGGVIQRNSSTIEPFGIGPCREDGSGSGNDVDVKAKAMAAEKKGDSGSTELSTNWLTCTDDGSSKHVYDMFEAKKGETASTVTMSSLEGDHLFDSNKKLEVGAETLFVGHIDENILSIILCNLPLHVMFQAQTVCTSWKTLISSSVHFHNLWEQNNMQMWLMMDLYDETGGDTYSVGVGFFDVSRMIWYKRMFNDEWGTSESYWGLRAGDGGLLVYSSMLTGAIRVLNPLTMQFHCLPDAMLPTENRVSFYIKTCQSYSNMHLKFDPERKTYDIIVIAYIDLPEEDNLVVLIYSSAQRRWEIREMDIDYIPMDFDFDCFPTIFRQNEKIYMFFKDEEHVGMYNLDVKENTQFDIISMPHRIMHDFLGIVMCKGRIIMVCGGETMQLPPYTHALIFYEFDEHDLQWKSKYEQIMSPKYLQQEELYAGGDYIWITERDEDGIFDYLLRIDIDSGEAVEWPALQDCNGWGVFLSMRLTFHPCS